MVKDARPLIELRGVSKIYANAESPFRALNNVTLRVSKGEFVAIMGPSGSGKSTLLNLLGGLDRPSEGSYLLNDEAVEEKTDRELAHLRGRRIGFIFQMFNLIPRLSVEKNVELPMVYAGVPIAERRERALEALKAVGLENKTNRTPDKLSGGEVQRVAIARAIANNPDIVLADEPTGNLDSKTGKEILRVLKELHRSGRTIILVTHDQSIAEQADRQIRIRDGEIEEGTA